MRISAECMALGPVTDAVSSPAVVFTPYSGSMSSVWLRDTDGSVMVVVPLAQMPASSTAVLSCAEAIGDSYVMALRFLQPRSVMGSVSAPAGSKSTPIIMSGAVIRLMGRLESDASPSMRTSMSHGASTPMSRRAVVPELAQ